MSLYAGDKLINPISLRQFYRYLSRHVWDSPVGPRGYKPNKRIRAPSDRGVGIFLYPPDETAKTSVLATGPLGTTTSHLHTGRWDVNRNLDNPTVGSEILWWGRGGAVSVLQSLISGVCEGFAVNLELIGVGYRAEVVKEGIVSLRVGFSHIVGLQQDLNGVILKVLTPQKLQVAGINYQNVHQRAAAIRDIRPPEPYKGKGIRYELEPVRRKETRKD